MKCNKISYRSRSLALKDLKVIKADINRYKNSAVKHNAKLKPYLCCWCDSWHLTSMTKSESRIQKEKQRKISIIKSIARNNTLSYLLSVSESWMVLCTDEMKVRFKGVRNKPILINLNK